MIKKKLILLLCIPMMLGSFIIGCGSQDKTNISTFEESINVSSEDKLSYQEIADKAVEEAGDVTDDIKDNIRKEAVYNAIFAKEGRDLLKDIEITDAEARVELQKDTRPKIVKVIDMKVKCTEEGHTHDEGDDYEPTQYYLYEGDDLLNKENIAEVFPDAKDVVVRDATDEDNIKELKRFLSANELVKIINAKVEKVLE